MEEKPLEKFKIESYYSITNDFEIEKQQAFNKKIKCKCWAFQIDTGRSHTTWYNNTYKIYEYLFFDNQLTQVYFSSRGWEILNLKDPEVNTPYARVEMTIYDPLGKVRIIETNNNSPVGFYEAIKFIKNVNKLPNWEVFDMINERQFLLNKIQILESSKKFKTIIKQFDKLNQDWEEIHQLENRLYRANFYNTWINKETKEYKNPKCYPEYYD